MHNLRSIGRFGLERKTRQMGTQHNTRHILPIAQRGSSPHDMSCPSKGITLCQSLKGTQEEFLCNTNTRALPWKVILTHAVSWPNSYNANSTLLTMIHYTSAHVWRRKAYKALLNYVGSIVNTSHVSLLSFLASGTRYDPHKWPHESTLFCPYL